MTVECVFQANDILGEGPVWSVDEQALYWVDIKRPALQRWHPASGKHKVWAMPSAIGSFALRQSGGAIVALSDGFHLFDVQSGQLTALTDPEADLPDNRFNDGRCDRQGRFWAGTMLNAETGAFTGSLYRLDPDHTWQKMRGQVGVSNGLGWSPDNRTMYYTDSPTHNIYAYDFDLQTGQVDNERVFVNHVDGFPDGLTVDAEGYVWSARWDGWKVIRFAPDGSIDKVVDMPVQRPTSCMFGGPELRHLYVTSAKINLSEDELARQPLAGNLFVIETNIPGLPEPMFAG